MNKTLGHEELLQAPRCTKLTSDTGLQPEKLLRPVPQANEIVIVKRKLLSVSPRYSPSCVSYTGLQEWYSPTAAQILGETL